MPSKDPQLVSDSERDHRLTLRAFTAGNRSIFGARVNPLRAHGRTIREIADTLGASSLVHKTACESQADWRCNQGRLDEQIHIEMASSLGTCISDDGRQFQVQKTLESLEHISIVSVLNR